MNQYDDDAMAAQSGWTAPKSLYVPATDADVLLFGRELRLCGWSMRETAGATALVKLRDGSADTAPIAAEIGFAANQAPTQWLGDQGIRLERGLFLEVAAGAIEGVIYARLPHIT